MHNDCDNDQRYDMSDDSPLHYSPLSGLGHVRVKTVRPVNTTARAGSTSLWWGSGGGCRRL